MDIKLSLDNGELKLDVVLSGYSPYYLTLDIQRGFQGSLYLHFLSIKIDRIPSILDSLSAGANDIGLHGSG